MMIDDIPLQEFFIECGNCIMYSDVENLNL